MVLLTALGVGGATLFGSILGFIFKKISHRFSDIVLSFAAGVMLAAAVLGLIVPSLDYGGKYAILITIAGIFEAIKKSPFFNGNYTFCPLPKNASAEIFADAQQ